MLFRRFRKHVENQDWFAVAVDFLIVVLGIFAALQVGNWNEERKDRIKERRYLVRLYDDATRTVERNESQRRFMVGHAELAGMILASLEACDLKPELRDDFATGVYQLGKLYPPYMATGTLEELRSTGNLAILRSIELRRELDRAVEEFTELDRVWPQAMARVTPPVNYVDGVVAIKIDRETSGNSTITWDQLGIDFDELCADPQFYNAIAAVRNYTFDVATWLNSTSQAFDRLRGSIAGEMRNQGLGDLIAD